MFLTLIVLIDASIMLLMAYFFFLYFLRWLVSQRTEQSICEVACHVLSRKFTEGLEYQGLLEEIERRVMKKDKAINIKKVNALSCLVLYYQEARNRFCNWSSVRQIVLAEEISAILIERWDSEKRR